MMVPGTKASLARVSEHLVRIVLYRVLRPNPQTEERQ